MPRWQLELPTRSNPAPNLPLTRLPVLPRRSTKAAAKAFVQGGEGGVFTSSEPLHALRRAQVSPPLTSPNLLGSPAISADLRAQVSALGGEAWVGEAAVASRLGGAIRSGDEPSEEFAVTAMEWVARHQAELQGREEGAPMYGSNSQTDRIALLASCSPRVAPPVGGDGGAATAVLDFFLEQRAIDADYTCVGRTPKTIRQALEAYVDSTTSFEQDEAFQPNPRGLKPWFEMGAVIPPETEARVPPLTSPPPPRRLSAAARSPSAAYLPSQVRVPYDGKYQLGGAGEYGSKPATVRVAEILSLRRLLYEGEQLCNCLEGSRRSQVKYVSRARARVSSFWSLTKQEEGGPVQYLCLVEVWHTARGNEIRQAEGPRPRTIPGPEAWYWMGRWCEREGVDLSTWDCYS